MSDRTTWTAPERVNDTKHFDGTRKNPFRDQNDYIIVKKKHQYMITNSSSYSGFETYTDHKLVKMVICLDWWRLPKSKPCTEKLNFTTFPSESLKENYQQNVKDEIQQETQSREDPNHMWNRISEICLKSGENTKGLKDIGIRRQESYCHQKSLSQKKQE